MPPRISRPTGFTTADAQDDFSRARRQRVLSRLAARMRGEPRDFDLILPFEEVIAALGRAGERSLGLQTIAVDSIVGTVDRSREFDRSFRPTSGRVRSRWERIAKAQRGGKDMPPISVYRIGELHFVRDGHHRVSVARALDVDQIDAYVTEVIPKVGAGTEIRLADLPLKSHERLFFERVPLPAGARGEIRLSDPTRYASLADAIEAWGFRRIQALQEPMDRAQVAEAWLRDEYEPVVQMLGEADLLGSSTETEAYMRVSQQRYMLLRTHDWDERVIERLREELR